MRFLGTVGHFSKLDEISDQHDGDIVEVLDNNVTYVYYKGQWHEFKQVKQFDEPLKIFISGPMSGYEKYNFPKFDEIEEKLVSFGYEVVNPARISRRYKEKDVKSDRSVYDKMVQEQIAAEKSCDAILLLNGWQKSKGVRRELELALLANMEVFLESDMDKLSDIKYRN